MRLHLILLPFIFFKNINIISTKIIKNGNYPACKNCVHFKPYDNGEFTSNLAKCENFGTKNILTDITTYDYADFCRHDEKKCGADGRYFEKEEYLELKLLKHKVIRFLPYFSIVSFYCFYVWIINK